MVRRHDFLEAHWEHCPPARRSYDTLLGHRQDGRSFKVGKSGGQKETTGLAKAGNFKTLTITFPDLTNKDDLPARAHLTIPRDKIPDV